MPTLVPFLFGYAGLQVESLLRLVQDRAGVVLDCRDKPHSKLPGWSYKELLDRLGDRYVWVGEWGNVNVHTDKGVEIADIEAGYTIFAAIRKRGFRPILLCVCVNGDRCHRRVIADWLEIEHAVKCAEYYIPRPCRRKEAAPSPTAAVVARPAPADPVTGSLERNWV